MFKTSNFRILCDLIIVTLCSFYLVFCYLIIEYHVKYKPICPFYLITSIHCPLCGMSRSFGELLHGNLNRSFIYHPFSIYLFLFFICFLVKNVLSLFQDLDDFNKINLNEVHHFNINLTRDNLN